MRIQGQIFRKVALDRLSVPEQLDVLLQISSARAWVGLAGVVLALALALVWGCFGSVSTKAAGKGVIVRSGGVQNVATLGAGQVAEVRAVLGAHLHVGDIVATVAQPAMLDQIKTLEGQIRDLETQQREMDRIQANSSKLQIASLDRQRANIETAIANLEHQAKLTREQMPVDKELFSKGLITREQIYATEQKLASLESEIQDKHAQMTQLESSEFNIRNQSAQEDLQLSGRIADARRALDALERDSESKSLVRTPYAGQVIELKVLPGALVQAGMPILSIQPDVTRLEALLYIPADKAKELHAGMAAEISPASIKREEFGFIRGRVTYVADYPATEEALMRVFENAPLVAAITGGGPATEVHVELEPDASTPSGFRWSSGQGAPIQLSGGTMIDGEAVTREQPPVSLVIPYIKEKIGLR